MPSTRSGGGRAPTSPSAAPSAPGFSRSAATPRSTGAGRVAKQAEREVNIDTAGELLADGKVDERVVDALRAERVREAVAELPAEQRDVLSLAFWGGYSQSEIAARTNTPLGTVKSRVRLGMTKLRDRLVDER
jgi:RNA polymerase sigma factor (sigma-70 family)